jgi:hypothetical protein
MPKTCNPEGGNLAKQNRDPGVTVAILLCPVKDNFSDVDIILPLELIYIDGGNSLRAPF